MAFCFSGSLLRANINIVFLLFNIVIVRGKNKFLLLLLLLTSMLAGLQLGLE